MTVARRPRWIAVMWIGNAGLVAVAVALCVAALLPTRTAAVEAGAPGVGGASTGLDAADVSLLGAVPSSGAAAPSFDLTDQRGRPVSLAGLRGQAVLLTFDDDRCTDVCTLYAQDVLAAERDLGANAGRVTFVSVDANPYYPAVSDVRAWTDQHGLGGVRGWDFVTGSPSRLAAAASTYGETVRLDPKNRTVEHGTDIAVIDPSGHERLAALYGTESADTELYGHALADAAVSVLPATERRPVSGTSGSVDPQGSLTGSAGPLTLPELAEPGRTVGLAHDGFTVLVFFSSSCTACAAELPGVEQEYRRRGASVQFLGVDVADSGPAAQSLLRRSGVTFPVGTDGAGAATARFGASELPYTVLVDGERRIVTTHPGLMTADQLDYLLQVLPGS